MYTNNEQRRPDIPRTSATLIFCLAGQEYGLPVTHIIQIVEMVTINPLPDTPQSIQGIINYHGRLVPVIDLRLHLSLPPKAYGLHTPIVLVNYHDQTLGLIVDTVEEILHISLSDVETGHHLIPADLTYVNYSSNGKKLAQVAKFDRRLILIPQIEALLSHQEQIELLKAMSEYELEEAYCDDKTTVVK